DKEIKTKLGECVTLLTMNHLPVKRVIAVGLGKKEEYGRTQARKAIACCARLASASKDGTLTCYLPSLSGNLSLDESAEVIAEGAWLGAYTFDKFQSSKKDKLTALNILINVKDSIAEARAGADEADIITSAVMRARDLVNEPAGDLNPATFATMAQKIAVENKLSYQEFSEVDLKDKGLNALLAVGKGSDVPPRLIIMQYKGDSATDKINLALVGKGITFDSGGLSLKPPSSMSDMKSDMAGAAAALSSIVAAAQMGLQINLVAVIPLAENMPSGKATKVGDVVKAYSGKTIEILNTDAEGRLILADAIAYTLANLKPQRLIDIATLTGAAMRALGLNTIAAFTNNQGFLNEVQAAGQYAGDNMWELPVGEEYSDMIRSDVADIKNTGGDYAGASTAAVFLQEFVDNTPWVHLDIAGPSFAVATIGHIVKGATGVPTATLIALVAQYSLVED
ncbi:MAG: leucyl aminopeptidase, partial [Chloroflexi bacterium]|nr:leucyl aminopeptidase [Chloroflexota bacterium]